MAKRLICLIVSVLMVVSLLPMGAFATEESEAAEVAQIIWASGWAGEKYSSFDEALEAANSGQTIRILSDFTITSAIDYGKTRSITIDLNGHTITVDSSACSSTYNAAIAISYNGTWTITDSVGGGQIVADGSSAKMLFYNRGTIVLESGSLVFSNYSGTSNCPAVITNAYASYAAGTFEMTGGTITFSTTSGSYAYAVVNNNTGTESPAVSISGGNINVPAGKWGTPIFSFADGSNYSITGGYFTTDPSDYVADGYAVVDTADETYGYAVLEEGYYLVEAYKSTSTYPTSEGKVFAGWYTDADCDEVYAETSGVAYARFVDESMLSVQCAFTYNVSGMGNIWRFFSSVDTTDFSGFSFTISSSDGETVYTTTNAARYPTSYTVTGVNHTFNATDFSSASKYVITDYYADNAMTLTTCNVCCSWTTADGTVVTGAAYTFTQNSETAVLTAQIAE